MKIIFDEKAYSLKKKTVKWKYFFPYYVGCAAIALIPVSCFSLFIVASLLQSCNKITLDEARIYSSVLSAVAFGILVLMFLYFGIFAKKIPANVKYGYYTERYKTTGSQRVTYLDNELVLEVFYKNKRNKTKSFYIPLRDNGFYSELSEPVVDLTYGNCENGIWYRPLEKYISDLRTSCLDNPLPDFIKEKLDKKGEDVVENS